MISEHNGQNKKGDKAMTLESVYNESKKFYEGHYGSLEGNCWWEDEGKPNAVMEYLSHCDDFSDEDWRFAEKEGIKTICEDILHFHRQREFLDKICR